MKLVKTEADITPFGTVTTLLSPVCILVYIRSISSTIPVASTLPFTAITSPHLNGLLIKMRKPPATLPRLSFRASAIAAPPAPRTVKRDEVFSPSSCKIIIASTIKNITLMPLVINACSDLSIFDFTSILRSNLIKIVITTQPTIKDSKAIPISVSIFVICSVFSIIYLCPLTATPRGLP